MPQTRVEVDAVRAMHHQIGNSLVSDNGSGESGCSWKKGFGVNLVERLAKQCGAMIIAEVGLAGARFELVCPDLWSADPWC